jgi:hypothetical protein
VRRTTPGQTLDVASAVASLRDAWAPCDWLDTVRDVAGRGAAWLARQSGGLEVPSSNLGAPTYRNPRPRGGFVVSGVEWLGRRGARSVPKRGSEMFKNCRRRSTLTAWVEGPRLREFTHEEWNAYLGRAGGDGGGGSTRPRRPAYRARADRGGRRQAVPSGLGRCRRCLLLLVIVAGLYWVGKAQHVPTPDAGAIAAGHVSRLVRIPVRRRREDDVVQGSRPVLSRTSRTAVRAALWRSTSQSYVARRSALTAAATPTQVPNVAAAETKTKRAHRERMYRNPRSLEAQPAGRRSMRTRVPTREAPQLRPTSRSSPCGCKPRTQELVPWPPPRTVERRSRARLLRDDFLPAPARL